MNTLTQEERLLFEQLQKKRKNSIEVYKNDGIIDIIINLIIDTYKESAHFIYELLQNADDVKATKVRIKLEKNKLLFIHNGKVPFHITNSKTEREDEEVGHLNSITTFSLSTKNSKEDAENKIGKFGIGFKAIYQYTLNPKVYNPPYNFRIENYMIPVLLEDKEHEQYLKEDETTLFILPFDNPDKLPEEVFEEVSEKLQTMSNPLLFLRNLTKIRWEIGDKRGKFIKKVDKDYEDKFDNLQVQEVILDKLSLLKLSRKVSITNKDITYNQNISIAFAMDEGNIIKADSDLKRNAYCFFQTEEYTGLEYLIHAPFILTPNRESIKEKNQINNQLIDELAKLSADSLDVFKSLKLLNDKVFEVLPLGDMEFEELGEAVNNKLKQGLYLPVNNGASFTTTENAYFSESKDLTKLLAANDFYSLKQLTGNPNAVWVLDSYSRGSSTAKNIREKVLIQDNFDPDKVAVRISKEFMTAMSDEWIISFYKFLRNISSTWKTIKTKPIIKLNDGSFISPFNDNDKPQVYLPSKVDTPAPTVSKGITRDKEALQFLIELGLIEPDESAKVWHEIIPNLKANKIDNDEDLLEVTKVIIRYYHNCDNDGRLKLKKQLPNVKFIRKLTKVFSLEKSTETYFYKNELKHYFSKTMLKVTWINSSFYKKLESDYDKKQIDLFLSEIGVNEFPKFVSREYDGRCGSIYTLSSKYTYQRYSSSNFYDYTIEGFDEFILNLDIEKSFYLFNFLKHTKLHNEYSQLKTISHQENSKSRYFYSYHMYYVMTNAWLYDKNMNLKKPIELFVEELNDRYNLKNAEELIKHLKFKQKVNLSFSDKIDKIRKKFPNLSEEEFLQKLEGLLDSGQSSPSNGSLKSEKTKLEKEGEAIVKGAKTKKDAQKPKSDDLEKDKVERDEFTPPSIDIEKELQKERELLEVKLAQLVYKAELEELVNSSEMYSFAWFKALLKLENQVNAEDRSQKSVVRAIFRQARLDGENILILSDTNFIPSNIEELGQLSIKLNFKDGVENINVDTVSVQKKQLKIKLHDSHNLKGINQKELTSAIVEVKNASFILDKLENAFALLPFEDDDSLHDNITPDIDFVFGPPGTGKTTHIAKEILIPMMEEEDDNQVLVLTPTNKAADVLCEKIMNVQEEANSNLYLDWLTRFGITNNYEIEQSEIFVQDKRLVKRKIFGNATVITTIARYPYDGFIVPNQNIEKNDGNDMDFQLKNFKWDYIIFDEASMIGLASILFVIYNAKQVNPNCKFIVAGDPFQISPVIFVDKKGWKDGNIYSMIGLNQPSSFKNPQTTPHDFDITNLTTQWRATEPLGTICSELSYDGILKHNRSVNDMRTIHLPELPLKPITIIYFNVNKEESLYKPRKLNGSNYHIYSALFTIEFINYIIQNLEIEDDKLYKIGIICPYKSQQGILDKLIQTKQSDNIEITTGTIHGFQGDECDMIINLLNPPSYISKNNNRIFLNKKNILNVSVSRGKDHLVLLIPRDSTGTIETENLYVIEQIKSIIKNNPQIKSHYKEYNSHDIEEVILGNKYAIEEFSFPTAHQMVNVYAALSSMKYEIRFDENAIDIQVNKTIEVLK